MRFQTKLRLNPFSTDTATKDRQLSGMPSKMEFKADAGGKLLVTQLTLVQVRKKPILTHLCHSSLKSEVFLFFIRSEWFIFLWKARPLGHR